MRDVLTRKEARWLGGLFGLLLISVVAFIFVFQYEHTTPIPKPGGSYREGIVGEPRFVNPVLSPANDADRDLVRLLFAGLMRYTPDGRLEPDLALQVAISPDGKTYTFTLRENLLWHDGVPLSAEDVLYTISIIQNPEYRSPIRVSWQGIRVETPDPRTVKMTLPNAYAPFLETATLGILPKHVWEKIPAKNFSLADVNVKPVGAGPYRFLKFQKDRTGRVRIFELEAVRGNAKAPYLAKLTLRFYPTEEEAIAGLNRGEVDGISFVSAQNRERLRRPSALALHAIRLPRYYAVFFNQSQSRALAEKPVRQALNIATNRAELIEKVIQGEGTALASPILPGLLGHAPNITPPPFSIEEASRVLEAAGWRDANGDGFREKVFVSGTGKKRKEETVPLEFTLTTAQSADLIQVGTLVKETWGKLGAKVSLEVAGLGEIQTNAIRPRRYQALLFGEVTAIDPDPFPFWHSSQKKDPGLNLALYGSKTVDKLLEEARQTADPNVRAAKYAEFQRQLAEDLPAIFLYSPHYLYPVSKHIKGIETTLIAEPSQRFADIANWYIKTRRVPK